MEYYPPKTTLINSNKQSGQKGNVTSLYYRVSRLESQQ